MKRFFSVFLAVIIAVALGTPDANAAEYDSMTILPNGQLTITSGDLYVRYPSGSIRKASSPKPIAGNWGDLPPAFEAGFDSMATLPNGKTYVTSGNQYIRYSES
jgi:hypothetical protein